MSREGSKKLVLGYEKTGGAVTKYYYAAGQRIAVRANGALYFLLGDHLGSTSLTTDANGSVVSELRYKAWGEVRFGSGSTPTQYTYTGQYSHTADFGLMFYNARWYDPALGRFAQADTLVPGAGNPQAWDRYAYGFNDPPKYQDPTGHKGCDDVDANGNCIEDPFWNWHNNNRLKVSDEGLEFIKKWEGKHKSGDLHTLYDDPAGNCTIGYGYLVHSGPCTNGTDTSETPFLNGITENQAEGLLRGKIDYFQKIVRRNVVVPLTQEEFDALVSFTYNVGEGNFVTSTLLEELNNSRYDSIPDYLNEWVWAYDSTSNTFVRLDGLVTRRYEEGVIFSEWIYP